MARWRRRGEDWHSDAVHAAGGGIFGLLRLRKWGWALVTAGCLLFAAGDFYYFSKIHQAFLLVRGLFVLAFFLYLVRQETRERLR